MQTMRAVQVQAPGAGLEWIRREIPRPGPGEVLLKVGACGICHGDSIALGAHFPGLSHPRIPGHEVAGVVEEAGPGVTNWKAGQRVGVGWHGGGQCHHCGPCRDGAYAACAEALVTGLSRDGGYAEYMLARAEALVPLPDGLSFAEAAPLLCAGRTTFGALKESRARAGDLVAIQGLGGLGHLAVQFAARMGFQTVAISRGAEKAGLARKLGAHAFIDTDLQDPARELAGMGGAAVIVATAPSGKAIGKLLDGLGRRGELVNVSGASDPLEIAPLALLHGERTIRGFVGGRIEEALAFATLWGIRPMVETFPLERAAEAFDRMLQAKARFRSVLVTD
jgi:D-arabinose 1-dehydrogenase-like Zn-dependent alcohol dehydrogenase